MNEPSNPSLPTESESPKSAESGKVTTPEGHPKLMILFGLIAAGALDVAMMAFLLSLGARGISDYAVWLILLCGAIQWIWLAPLAIFTRRFGHRSFSNGVLIAGGLVSTFNAACWGVIALK